MTDDQVPIKELKCVYPELAELLQKGKLSHLEVGYALIADGFHRFQNLSPNYITPDNWFDSGKPPPFAEILTAPGYRKNGEPDVGRDGTRRLAVYFKPRPSE